MIKHIWFDLAGTLIKNTDSFNEAHNQLRYRTYAELVGKPVDERLRKTYEDLYAQCGSNSAVFSYLGCKSDFWQQHFNTLDKSKYYKPEKNIYLTLNKLKEKVPISLFTNLNIKGIKDGFKLVKIEIDWFTHILTGDDVPKRKPAADGFIKMVDLSDLPPNELLYVGDRVNVDILPAKKLGMKTCLVWSNSSEADYSFENFEDILKVLKS